MMHSHRCTHGQIPGCEIYNPLPRKTKALDQGLGHAVHQGPFPCHRYHKETPRPIAVRHQIPDPLGQNLIAQLIIFPFLQPLTS
jgi:hypothetical protein